MSSQQSTVEVRVGVNRCPYCHTDVAPRGDAWVSCRSCQTRHHQACWAEAARCCSCGDEARLTLERAPRAPRWRSLAACAGGVAACLLALQAPSYVGQPLDMLRYSGVCGLLTVLLGAWLLLRAAREALGAPRLSTSLLASLPLGLGLVGTGTGFAAAWDAVSTVPQSALFADYARLQLVMQDATLQAWTSTTLGAYASLAVFVVCLAGLLKPAWASRPPRTEAKGDR